jgi:hypothetical protein
LFTKNAPLTTIFRCCATKTASDVRTSIYGASCKITKNFSKDNALSYIFLPKFTTLGVVLTITHPPSTPPKSACRVGFEWDDVIFFEKSW